MKTGVVLAVVMTLAGCSREENRTPDIGRSAQDRGEGTIDPRSQQDLAVEIAQAERLRKDEQDARYGAIRKSWLGKRVTWKVDVLPALCRAADRCHALAFDRVGADRAIVQGWMPRLRLDAAGFASLEARCAGRARCPVTIQATVAAFTLSIDEPTSLTLAQVTLPLQRQ